jgi:hypothetical protein
MVFSDEDGGIIGGRHPRSLMRIDDKEGLKFSGALPVFLKD